MVAEAMMTAPGASRSAAPAAPNKAASGSRSSTTRAMAASVFSAMSPADATANTACGHERSAGLSAWINPRRGYPRFKQAPRRRRSHRAKTDHGTLHRHPRHRWMVSAGTELNSVSTARPTSQNGLSSRVVVTMEARAMVAEMKSVVPTGGVYSPIERLSTIITPS